MRRHLVVTGASSGIGAAVCRRAAAAGWTVTGLARRGDRLRMLAEELGSAFCGEIADVTDGAALEEAMAAGVARHGPIHALVANAGRGCDGELLDLSPEDLAAVMDVNLLGVHRSVRASRGHWAEGARVVIVASILSFFTVPRMGAYSATKYALDSYADALRMELAAVGHPVVAVHPGTVATEFFDAAPRRGGVWTWRPGRPLAPDRVARVILAQAGGRPRRRRVLPRSARIAIALARHWPGCYEWVMRRRLAAMRRAETVTREPFD